MKKKILLINAINPIMELEQRYPPLGLGYLVSCLRQSFKDAFEFKIIDRCITKTIEQFKPDIIFLSSVTQNYDIAKKYAQIAKKYDVSVILGGIHISMLPQNLTKDVDVAVIGEGEKTIVELMKLFLAKNTFKPKDLNKIKGIAYYENNTLIQTAVRPLIKNLDELPLPARDLMKIGRHASMFSSRGCPYRCIFCASSKFWNQIRFFSAEYVVNEIKEVYNKYDADLISFYDDLFIANKPRLKEIITLLKKENLLGKVKFSCSCRANLMDEHTVRLLKQMNVVSVAMGLESGCQEILQKIKGNTVTVEHGKKAIHLLNKYKIAANASFIIGSPGETKQQALQTYTFIQKNKLNNVNIYVIIPYPGTPIWEIAKQKGLVSENMDWAILDNVSFLKNKRRAVIVSDKMTRGQLIRLYKKFQRLRYWILLNNSITHPFAKDIPKIVFGKIKEKIYM